MILDGDASLFKNVVNHNGFVKSFYAVIKEYVGLGVVDRFFATGICPITLNSMTTGFNIATDIRFLNKLASPSSIPFVKLSYSSTNIYTLCSNFPSL